MTLKPLGLALLVFTPALVAYAAEDVSSVLVDLVRPEGAPAELGTDFSANAYEQIMLNFQMPGGPEATAEFYQAALTEAGYSERALNTVVGAWGFNLVFDLPETLDYAASDADKTVVLVLQGTQLSPDSINVNIRFEEV